MTNLYRSAIVIRQILRSTLRKASQNTPHPTFTPDCLEHTLKMTEILSLIPKAHPALLIAFGVGLLICTISAVLIVRSAAVTAANNQTDQRLEKLERQLDDQSKKLDQLLSRQQTQTTVIVNMDFPVHSPVPEKNVGFHAAVEDTLAPAATAEKPTVSASAVFKPITESDSLVNLVLAGEATVSTIVLNTRSSNVSSSTPSDHEVSLEIGNVTDKPISIRLPKGQVFENKVPGSGFQNLVLADHIELTLAPRERRSISVPGHCLNVSLKRPSGQAGNITPLAVDFEFDTQRALWKEVDSRLAKVLGSGGKK